MLLSNEDPEKVGRANRDFVRHRPALELIAAMEIKLDNRGQCDSTWAATAVPSDDRTPR